LIPAEPLTKGDAWFLALSCVPDGDRIIWRVAGRLGTAGAAALMEGLMSSFIPGRRVVLDLEGVDYVSGAGVQALETIAKAAQRTGGSLELVNLADPVQICLDLAGPLAHVRAAPRV